MVDPATADMDEFAFKMEARNRTVDGKDVLASFRTGVAQRPHRTVLGPNQKVKGAVFDERDGTNATRLEGEFGHHLQSREREHEHVASSGPHGSSIHGAHGTAKGQQDGGQIFQRRPRRSAFEGFPGDAPVVHRNERTVIGGEAADDGSLLHDTQESLKVHLGFAHPSQKK